LAGCAYGLLKLALIGSVILGSEGGLIFIILCDKDACAHLGFMEIGFVLHKIVVGIGVSGYQAVIIRVSGYQGDPF